MFRLLKILIGCLFFVATITTANAQSGTRGNLLWSIADSTLTISGTGEMLNSFPPWYPYSESVTSVIIESGVTSIQYSAFAGYSGLTSVTIPNTVTFIGGLAFRNCHNLTSVAIPNSVIFIGESAFAGCSGLASITIPESVEYIGKEAFFGCYGLTSITIPNSVTYIGDYAFRICSGYYTYSMVSIMAHFSNCYGLTSIDVGDNNTAYASENGVLFNKTKTALIQYPAGKIDKYYTISNSITSIGNGAFADCISLISLIIPNSVTSIGTSAFANCIDLTEIINHAIIPQIIDARIFYFVDEIKCTLRVPAEAIETYRAAEGWKKFVNIEAITE